MKRKQRKEERKKEKSENKTNRKIQNNKVELREKLQDCKFFFLLFIRRYVVQLRNAIGITVDSKVRHSFTNHNDNITRNIIGTEKLDDTSICSYY